MENKIGVLKKRRYEALRYLYNNPLTFKQLFSFVHMDERDLVGALSSLMKWGALEKEKMSIEMPSNKEIQAIAEGGRTRAKVEKKEHRYHVTDRGKSLLAWYEWIDGVGQNVSFPSIFEDENYRKETWEIIQKDSYLKNVYEHRHPEG